MLGVVRWPSWFSITRAAWPSMTATHELVVPRSMPMMLPAPGQRSGVSCGAQFAACRVLALRGAAPARRAGLGAVARELGRSVRQPEPCARKWRAVQLAAAHTEAAASSCAPRRWGSRRAKCAGAGGQPGAAERAAQ